MFSNLAQKLQTKEGLFGTLSLAILIVTVGFIVHGFSFTQDPTDYPGIIMVSGTGEVSVSPDIARFTFSSSQDAKTIAEARTAVAGIVNPVIDQLKASGIQEKDIKTDSFNVYPKYEYVQEVRCSGTFCPPWNPGNQELVGFTYTVNYSVTLRDLDKTSDIGKIITDGQVSSVQGPNFTVDDMDALKNQAKAAAIRDAKSQSRQIAKQLGVRLGKIMDFQVVGSDGYYPMYAERGMVMASAPMKASPEMPTGETKVATNVTITYRLK